MPFYRLRHGFTPQMMTDLGGGGDDRGRGIPGAQIRTIEPHAAERDMEKGRHDDARIWPIVNPLVARQAIDPFGYKAVVRPTGQLHHGNRVGRGRDRIEQADPRETRRHKPVGRTRRGKNVAVGHPKPISLSL